MRRMWVMYRLALIAKTNPSGLSARHFSNVPSPGSR
jgi:hypothetical protein